MIILIKNLKNASLAPFVNSKRPPTTKIAKNRKGNLLVFFLYEKLLY